MVDVYRCYSGSPSCGIMDARNFGNIFKCKIACIEIQYVCGLIGGEVYIIKPIIIEIGDGGSCAIIKVKVIEYVERCCVVNGI